VETPSDDACGQACVSEEQEERQESRFSEKRCKRQLERGPAQHSHSLQQPWTHREGKKKSGPKHKKPKLLETGFKAKDGQLAKLPRLLKQNFVDSGAGFSEHRRRKGDAVTGFVVVEESGESGMTVEEPVFAGSLNSPRKGKVHRCSLSFGSV